MSVSSWYKILCPHTNAIPIGFWHVSIFFFYYIQWFTVIQEAQFPPSLHGIWEECPFMKCTKKQLTYSRCTGLTRPTRWFVTQNQLGGLPGKLFGKGRTLLGDWMNHHHLSQANFNQTDQQTMCLHRRAKLLQKPFLLFFQRRNTPQFWYNWCYSGIYASLFRSGHCCFLNHWQTKSATSSSQGADWSNSLSFSHKPITWSPKRCHLISQIQLPHNHRTTFSI